MTTKILSFFRYFTIISILLLSIIACETDLENVGGDLVDNGVFGSHKTTFELIAHTKNIEASRVDNLGGVKMPFGILKSDDFGLLNSGIIAQVGTQSNIDWEDAILDAVYLEIPYSAKSIRVAADNVPKFELDSIYGDKDVAFQLRVSRLDTYLSRLDPIDPTQNKKYYSDKVYSKSNEFYYDAFKPNAEDTMMVYQRTLLSVDGINASVQVNDTVKIKDTKPFIKIPLNKTFFKTNFIDNADQTVFNNVNDFREFFNGIVLEAEGIDGSMMLLDFSIAKINLYLSSSKTEEKTEFEMNADLDGNGSIDGEEVDTKFDVRNKKVVGFPVTGIKTTHYDRDYSTANGNMQITNPNTTLGEQKIYVQGTAGSVAVIDLFNGVDLDEIRAKNWLINEASITFYIDNQNDNDVPNRLLLYKLDPNEANGINENSQIIDAITEPGLFNGILQKDGDSNDKDEDRNPIRYKVNITDYITKVLKNEDFIAPTKLGLKIYNGFDTPSQVTDTIVVDYSWNPQGVVLFGNKFIDTDADFDKRIKLDVYYTELK